MSGLRSWTGREFHRRGPAAANVLTTLLLLLLSNKLILDAACIVCGAGLMKRLSIYFFIWQWHAAGLLLSTMQAGDINQQWRVLGAHQHGPAAQHSVANAGSARFQLM